MFYPPELILQVRIGAGTIFTTRPTSDHDADTARNLMRDRGFAQGTPVEYRRVTFDQRRDWSVSKIKSDVAWQPILVL